MQRRGSSGSSSSAPGLRRQPSSGSMSERTFRSPSPSGRVKAPAPADANAPPVPAIPKDLSPASKHRRAASEAALGSGRPGDRGAGVSTERAPRHSPDAKDGSQRASINFSRPISPRDTPPASPPPMKKGHSGWFTSPVTSDQKPRQDIRTTAPIVPKNSTTNATGLGLSIQHAANAPVAKKKKKKAGVEGRHLSEGGMASKPRGGAASPESSSSLHMQSPQRSAPAPELPPSPQSPQSSSLSDISTDSESSGPRSKPSPLVRKPSTVMENPEVEEEAEKAELGGHPVVAKEAPASTMSKEGGQRAVSPQNDQRVGRGADSEKLKPDSGRAKMYERQSSLSPARSAHFAPTAVDISIGMKHQPPPRSISPAKSALKHSPSSSIRTSSPVASHAVGRAHSDVSSDAGSYDGYKPSPRKKKKGVRVSFEENITREEDSPSSPSSPAGLESSRWSGRTLQGMDDDLDEIMKPRPALPSFGSIRRERRPVDEEIAEKVTETVPSMSNSTSTMAEPLEASSDHAVGGVLARDYESKRRSKSVNHPIAPEVTSVEGSGYASDNTESSLDESEPESNERPRFNGAGSGATTLPAIPEKKSAEASPALEVPSVPQIAVQPATPGTDAENQEPPFEMPGSWSDPDDESFDESLATTTASLASQEHSDTADAARGGRFHVFSAKDLQPVESRQSSVDRYLDHSADESSDEDSDNSSIYSDAAEDLSELDGGFASLDAIVESPIIPPPSETHSVSPPESPLADKQEQQPSSSQKGSAAPLATTDVKGEDQPARAVSSKHKQKSTVKAAALEYDAAPILKSPKPKKKATVVPEPVAVAVGPTQKTAPLPHAREAPQPKKPALRTSMRSERHAAEHNGASAPSMRKPMRTSMRDAPAGFAVSRYSEPAIAEAREPKGALQKKNIPLASAKAAPAPNRRSAPPSTSVPPNRVLTMPPLSRTLSNDSDVSDSSFKRQRRASSSFTDGRYTMRRSMRSGPSPRAHASTPAPTLRATPSTAAAAPRSSKLSIRSLSPTGSFFGKRKPMISTQDSSYPTLRTQGSQPAKPSRFSTSKASGRDLSKSGSPRFQSRYEDSSDDEGDARLPTFRSRFADSDDEDEVAELSSGLRPVRGIPRRADDDGDSTELEDEASDTEGPASPAQASTSQNAERRAAAATNGHPNGATAGLKNSMRDSKSATDSPVSPSRKEKRGFFGLGKKRRDSADVPPKTPPDATSPVTTGSPRAKLHRRDSHGRRTSESWPLPPAVPDENPNTAAGRPTTSDDSPTRPRLSKRQSSGGETAESEPLGNVIIGRSGKKKKFPMLRKAFRLKD